ncbi:hypothetical protein ILUMI_11572 [Ignelater luminosus]|uniref:Pacifastin domain-containing protein n=1 Tax=Ignelater luminosus TaxID=2038154 RepID=A0A8K0CZW2_IGNLU|nr:hypothetical protein ILUMI_11572 [Ignelater luminosus]
MQCSWFFCVLFCFLYQYVLIKTVEGKTPPTTQPPLQYGKCIPHQDYKVDCNRCWCNSQQIFVCTKMNCKDIPRQFWEKVKLTGSRRPKTRSAFLTLITIPFIAGPLFRAGRLNF